MAHSEIPTASRPTEVDLTGGDLSVTSLVDGSEIARINKHRRADPDAPR